MSWIPFSRIDLDLPSVTILVANEDSGQTAPMVRGVIQNNVGTSWDWTWGQPITHYMLMPEIRKQK